MCGKISEYFSDSYHIWQHATYLFHKRRYAYALLTFQYIILQRRTNASTLRRLHINIGLTHLALHAYYLASAAFHAAISLRESTNDDFITSANTKLSKNGSSGLTALATFLFGIACWELGVLEKSKDCFDICVELFDESELAAPEASESCMRYIDFNPLGLAYVLDIGQARQNSKVCMERINLERRVPMKSVVKWEFHQPRHGALFKADKMMFMQEGPNLGEELIIVGEATSDNADVQFAGTEAIYIHLDDSTKLQTTAVRSTANQKKKDASLKRIERSLTKTVTFSRDVEIIPDNEIFDRSRNPIRPTSVCAHSCLKKTQNLGFQKPLPPLSLYAGICTPKAIEIKTWLEMLLE